MKQLPETCRHSGNRWGFTLLEVLVVITILGLLTALAVPAVGYMDRLERERITRERIQVIRRSIIGPEDRFDEQGRPVIGGYLRDMKAWPDLWEPRADLRESFSGGGWGTPSAMTAGLGQWTNDPLTAYRLNPSYVYFRPSGSFEGGRWKWQRPYRKLYHDTASNADHIGGLETENEGQPRGLWTRYPEELTFDFAGHPAPGEDLGTAWKGPYLNPPTDANLSDTGHWAVNDDEYAALEPTFHATGAHTNFETWEDGDNAPTTAESGELFDEKELFRLQQGDGRLADGWGRAFRFFITADPVSSGETIFWIVSEGADQKAYYPTKGACSGHSWSVNSADVMSAAYNESHPLNKDNVVVKLYSRDWKASFNELELDNSSRTRRIVERIRLALLGESPSAINSGYSGDLLAWPKLFRWEGSSWDDQDGAAVSYSKGQPRGLWTATPNSANSADDLAVSKWGLGWRRSYHTPPDGAGPEAQLVDAWGKEILFFHDTANDSLLILSRGQDGKFTFGAINTDNTEPANPVELLNVSSYDPAAAYNQDNIYMVVRKPERFPGFFMLNRLVVYNATAGITKAHFFRDDGTPVSGVDLLVSATLTDEDGDGTADDWSVGSENGSPAAFVFHDSSAYKVPTGARYLVIWNDTDGDGEIDAGESHYPLVYTVTAAAGSGQNGTIRIYAADLWPAP
jgi:prepilin-type N-terminal cleavage/methylation domain-containing protein